MPEWTEGRRNSFIRSTIRSGFRRWPAKYNVIKAAFTERKINVNTGRLANHYRCASCKGEFVQTQIQVDHVEPVVDPRVGHVSWDDFINKLFCTEANLAVLCKPCHKEKTSLERKIKDGNNKKR